MTGSWDGIPMPRRLLAILAVMFAVSLSVLDGVITNIALPTICESLDISASESIWIVNAYQIATIVSLLPLAAIGDFVGYRKVYIAGLCLFIVMSMGCAQSWNFESLVLFRILQGFGASAVMSINTSIVRLIYPKRMLGRGLGINSTVVSVSAVAGPTIAAAIMSIADWRWLFIINLPLGLLAIILGYIYLPHNPILRANRGFKWLDMLLNTLSFGLLFAVVTEISHNVDWWIIALTTLCGAAIGYIFVRRQLVSDTPILPFDLLRIPIFSLSVVTSILSFITQMSFMVSVPFILHIQFGFSPVEIGAVMTSWPIVNMFTTPIVGLLVERFHAGILGCIGLTILSIGMATATFIPDAPTTFDLFWRFAICGLGFGFFQAPNNSIIISSSPLSRSGSASGMMATARITGQIIGAASVSMLFYIIPEDSLSSILYLSLGFAIIAMILSYSRLSQQPHFCK